MQPIIPDRMLAMFQKTIRRKGGKRDVPALQRAMVKDEARSRIELHRHGADRLAAQDAQPHLRHAAGLLLDAVHISAYRAGADELVIAAQYRHR